MLLTKGSRKLLPLPKKEQKEYTDVAMGSKECAGKKMFAWLNPAFCLQPEENPKTNLMAHENNTEFKCVHKYSLEFRLSLDTLLK